MSEIGEDVRERSPLHEVGARDWPREEEERDRFRIRVRRNQTNRANTVSICLLFQELDGIHPPGPSNRLSSYLSTEYLQNY